MSLNLTVCIKTVALKAPDKAGRIPRDAYALNPFDQPAMEAALELRGKYGGKITGLSMGPPWATAALHEALALGFDRAVLLSDPALADSDTLATSTALAATLEKLKPWDLILFGSRTADGDTGHVGPQTACGLNIPMVAGTTKIAMKPKGLEVVRNADGLIETYKMTLPGAVTIHAAGWSLREIPLTGIQTSYGTGTIETWSLADIGLLPDRVGTMGSPTRVVSTRTVKGEKTCTFIEGNVAEQADQLVSQLKDQGMLD
jgi:electron transfer flavoprotein beta subunit